MKGKIVSSFSLLLLQEGNLDSLQFPHAFFLFEHQESVNLAISEPFLLSGHYLPVLFGFWGFCKSNQLLVDLLPDSLLLLAESISLKP